MFGELLKDITDSVSASKGLLRHGTATRTITVAKPYCSPARSIVTGALQPYGVRIYGYSEEARMAKPADVLKMARTMPGDLELAFPSVLPIAQVAKVTVSEAAAAWAEYLLLRTGKLYRVGPYINKRNEQWAARHGGQMPPAWRDGKPWIEASCSSGVRQWQAVKDAAKHGQRKG